jgi:hypothetical protein
MRYFETGTVHLYEVPFNTPFRTRNTEGYKLLLRVNGQDPNLGKDWCLVVNAKFDQNVAHAVGVPFSMPRNQLVHLPIGA